MSNESGDNMKRRTFVGLLLASPLVAKAITKPDVIETPEDFNNVIAGQYGKSPMQKVLPDIRAVNNHWMKIYADNVKKLAANSTRKLLVKP